MQEKTVSQHHKYL